MAGVAPAWNTWWALALAAFAIVALLFFTMGPARARGGYEIAVDAGSRYNFRYVRDRQSGLWVHLHCELRVPQARELPEPLSTRESGDRISFTRYRPGSMGSAGIAPKEFKLRDGHRVWLWRELAGEADFAGKASLGAQISWPVNPRKPPRFEAAEIFPLPAIPTLTPYAWSPWRRAGDLRAGQFAG